MTIRRLSVLAFLAALLGGGVFLASQSGLLRYLFHGVPSETDVAAKKQVDSLPAWKSEVELLRPVLDSLLADLMRAKADSARVARQLRQLAHRKDSLALITATLQAQIESLPPLVITANASDSTAYWLNVATGQGQVIRTMAEEILACRQGDAIYEGRTASLEGALASCQKRAAIFEGQRNRAQLRLDRSVALLDKMLQEKRREFLGFLPHWTKCVLPAAGGGGAGMLLDRENQLRGAVLAGGSALVGCLVS